VRVPIGLGILSLLELGVFSYLFRGKILGRLFGIEFGPRFPIDSIPDFLGSQSLPLPDGHVDALDNLFPGPLGTHTLCPRIHAMQS
jgi:hypothetical protein